MADSAPEEKSNLSKKFQLEITPQLQSQKAVINPDVPFKMTVRNMSEEIQQVVVEVNSQMFELKKARAKYWPKTQIYHKVEPGGSMSFQIRLVKSVTKERTLFYGQKREGWLTINHITDTSMGDTDDDWGFIVENPEYQMLPGRRFVPIDQGEYKGHEQVDLELICEKETKSTRKIREQLKKREEPKSGGCCIL